MPFLEAPVTWPAKADDKSRVIVGRGVCPSDEVIGLEDSFAVSDFPFRRSGVRLMLL